MDPSVAIVAIIAKALIAILLASGGILAIFKGVQLFRDGVGLKPEKTTVEIFKKVKVVTSSAGAVLMLTAVGWGWLATRSFVEYSADGSIVRVASTSSSIQFPPTEAELSPASETALQKFVARLKARPNSVIAVSGVATKADGSEAVQSEIAGQRATTVKTYLVKSGIAPDRIETFKMIGHEQWTDTDPSRNHPSVRLTEIPSSKSEEGARDAGSRNERAEDRYAPL
ncbi:OmpA family protein [Candidatus Binatus sp.]|uniref:OmpA family protein n=1 Tax=Candidatus Binatus sp. TaxID=2811406 RepID=UPI003C34CE35